MNIPFDPAELERVKRAAHDKGVSVRAFIHDAALGVADQLPEQFAAAGLAALDFTGDAFDHLAPEDRAGTPHLRAAEQRAAQALAKDPGAAA
ncbi:hypothetical protein BIV57_00150 [Mangrovactinospora gilvigrisea]|uniref:Uncharacterized protein n=2 Tax=Mangrovactinospora gilvigrisea TaxID=1428644 RepID=A0A1J7BL43_9ACTN|nr:hypothetical protein BIV57_00150 [Mangrovactinospora gilvigrisea]